MKKALIIFVVVILAMVIIKKFSFNRPSISVDTPNNIAVKIVQAGRGVMLKTFNSDSFPIKLDDRTYVTNFSAEDNFIVYDYLIKNNSASFRTANILRN